MHEPIDAALGDRREIRHRDREQVERHRDRLPVEVAAAHQRRRSSKTSGLSVAALSSRDDEPDREVDRVEHGAVHLRHAAQRVRILHARIARSDATRESRCPRAARAAAPPIAAWPTWPRAS